MNTLPIYIRNKTHTLHYRWVWGCTRCKRFAQSFNNAVTFLKHKCDHFNIPTTSKVVYLLLTPIYLAFVWFLLNIQYLNLTFIQFVNILNSIKSTTGTVIIMFFLWPQVCYWLEVYYRWIPWCVWVERRWCSARVYQLGNKLSTRQSLCVHDNLDRDCSDWKMGRYYG